MLEIKNVVKTYKPKRGEHVKALKGVNLSFGEKGMVFILGKSGCGKSTLLNVIGGLDAFDSGEIIIKGRSSSTFSGSDFDSYRNTLIGFIFQEYNILNEFNVEKNIALALELQGKKATPDKVRELLELVDLGELAKRKPTELSGGQKQRIAIARALIKDPEIIIADEPTGALDSATGIQVFETLKKLSKDRLVIIVSHDREFAERYGDRVIEMVDGLIKSDETKRMIPPKEISKGFNIIGNDLVHIEKGHSVTEKEMDGLKKLINSTDREVVISLSEKRNVDIKRIAKIDSKGNSENFDSTAKEDLNLKNYDGKKLKLIRSKMKFKDSFKMGASGLKSKPIRLVLTIFICFVSFALFGLADTVASYKREKTAITSIVDSNIQNLSLVRQIRNGDEGNYYYNSGLLKASDIDSINEELSLNLKGVYTNEVVPSMWNFGTISFDETLYSSSNIAKSKFYNSSITGLIEMTRKEVEDLGFDIIGDGWIEDSKDVVITKYIAGAIMAAGYKDNDDSTKSIKASDLTSMEMLIGKKIVFGGSSLKIKAIVDTKLNEERYAALKEESSSNSGNIFDSIIFMEFANVVGFGYHNLIIVKEGTIDSIIKEDPNETSLSVSGYSISMTLPDLGNDGNKWYSNFLKVSDLSATQYKFKSGVTALGENQFLLHFGDVVGYNFESNFSTEFVTALNLCYNNDREIYQTNIYNDILSNPVFFAEIMSKVNETSFIIQNYNPGSSYDYTANPAEIVGIFLYGNNVITNDGTLLVSNKRYEDIESVAKNRGVYGFALTAMPTTEEAISKIVNFHYAQYDNSDLDYRFQMVNEISFILDSITQLFETLAKVFLIIGLVFAFIAAFMMMMFISTSISYKKREIGILRAIGARSTDVFGIFFNESIIIAAINAILSVAGSIAVTITINYILRNQYGLLITFINFGIRQILLIVAVSVLVAFIGSFLPVYNIARKKPIDAINNR